jgi:diacylglycerol kinase
MPLLPLSSLPSGGAEPPAPVRRPAPPRAAPEGDPASSPPGESPRRRRPWRDKFKFAFRGVKLGIRGHSSFAVHFFFTALVLAAAGILIRDPLEWCILLGCIGLVLTAELFNSALETLFRGLDEATQARVWPSLDIAAGAVLLASIVAAVIGLVVFLRHLPILHGA